MPAVGIFGSHSRLTNGPLEGLGDGGDASHTKTRNRKSSFLTWTMTLRSLPSTVALSTVSLWASDQKTRSIVSSTAMLLAQAMSFVTIGLAALPSMFMTMIWPWEFCSTLAHSDTKSRRLLLWIAMPRGWLKIAQ